MRPLSLYPLALLLPLLLVQTWRKKINLYIAGALVALGAFVLFVFASTSFGLVIDPIPLRGQIYSGRAVRALATMLIGLVFFICAIWMNKDEHDLRFSVKWILAGLCLDLAWSGLQAVTFYTGLLEKEMVTHWQLAFSMRELVRTNRISGLAYEPAWLAGQLSTIFIPILFAAVLTNFRLTRFKMAGTCSTGILPAHAFSYLLTRRIVDGCCRGCADVPIPWRRGDAFCLELVHPRLPRPRPGCFVSRWNDLVIVGAVAGTFLFLGQKNFFRRLWEINAESLSEYIIDINAGARGAYTTGALAAFEAYPWTGQASARAVFTSIRTCPIGH